jgi:hypothetical protein
MGSEPPWVGSYGRTGAPDAERSQLLTAGSEPLGLAAAGAGAFGLAAGAYTRSLFSST